ncbi:MAG TPA: DUF1223 domain-containing protein [Acidobacteriaceae bacterium]|nr:DUF1223 domain-containing protein [Acidobacteriaceae bacterium]
MTLRTYIPRIKNGRRLAGFFAVLATVLTLTCVCSGWREPAAGSQIDARYPILLELFTSEGCSSCPPVDAWVEKLNSAQPIANAQLIVLSEHVDYWDQDGWKDPYSSGSLTARQSDYARKLGIPDVYTPQLILGGSTELHLNNPQQVQQAFNQAAAPPAVSVRIDSIKVESGSPNILEGHVEVSANPNVRRGDVYVAVALDHAASQVLKGENQGRDLSYVNVVEELAKVGKLEKGKSFDNDFHVKLEPGSGSKDLNVIAFVQEPGPGKVIGATMDKNVSQSPATSGN